MKITEKSTDKILVRAYTDSEWDNCNFAIIHICDKWKDIMITREEYTSFISSSDNSFASVRYYDTSVSFYHKDNELLEELLGDGYWSFVELDDNEEKDFSVPDNKLDTYCVSMFPNGVFMYSAFGKHTNEEFFTEELRLSDLVSKA